MAAASPKAKPVTFTASIPPIETAIKIHGDGGARLILDIAEDCLAEFLAAFSMRGKILKVTLKETNSDGIRSKH
jgi:hypothetical protein